jgi:hypothetical protein
VPSGRESLRSEARQQREECVDRRMPRLGRASGEPHGHEIRDREKPGKGDPEPVLEPHISSSGHGISTPSFALTAICRSRRSPQVGRPSPRRLFL